ncbi:hypothetical protein [Kribbella sp. NBC_00359]|uniref:hypothetical protein n=1 Tax=Kribbella sp. NBC_00359 TaxID=2975966 RepID=UPI002E1E4853
MSKKTHQQQLARRRAQRQAERHRRRRMLTITVSSIVAVIVGVFVALGNIGNDTPAAGSTLSASTPTNLPSTAGPDNKTDVDPDHDSRGGAEATNPTGLRGQLQLQESADKASKVVKNPAHGTTKASGTGPRPASPRDGRPSVKAVRDHREHR